MCNLCFTFAWSTAFHLHHGNQHLLLSFPFEKFLFLYSMNGLLTFGLFLSWLTACSFLFLFFPHYLGLMFSYLIFLPLSVSMCDLFLHCCVAVKCSPAVHVSICGFCDALVHADSVAPSKVLCTSSSGWVFRLTSNQSSWLSWPKGCSHTDIKFPFPKLSVWATLAVPKNPDPTC